MIQIPKQRLITPRAEDLGLVQLRNEVGLRISVLPNGALFALEHLSAEGRILINQVLGSPVGGAMGRVCVRIGGRAPRVISIAGGATCTRAGGEGERFLWQGESGALRHELSLQLLAGDTVWLWRVEVHNAGADALPCDVVLIQDLGLGEPGFVMNNEAYASQYIDHHAATDPARGQVLMSRQNLAQRGAHPWVAHGCVEGAVGFATDLRQLMGPAHRDADDFAIPFGTDLASIRLQHEAACAALQSRPAALAPGGGASWTFFGIYRPDHPAPSADEDLALISSVAGAPPMRAPPVVPLGAAVRSVLQDAPCAVADPLSEPELSERYPRRLHVERSDGRLLSLFTPDEGAPRHVVLRDKEREVLRRHGALLLGAQQLWPDEETLCVTCWMHGVFGAQLTIGNTSFHRLLSISRDPYNINRASGLRMLVDSGTGWRLLTVPSAYEIGLADCRWIYRFGARVITVAAAVSATEPAVQWQVLADGEPCRLLIFAHLVLGEQEYAQAACLELDLDRRRFSARPDPASLWGQRYPGAVYHLVTSTPESVAALGGDELLYRDGRRRGGAYAVIETRPTREFAFAVVGSMTDPQRAEALAVRYAQRVDAGAVHSASARHWRALTRELRIAGADGDDSVAATNSMLPWLVHDALVHLLAPHGLEQYTGGAWGTRDVCQGPIECLLTLEHDAAAKRILEILFAQQYRERGDWPQWFMLEPYSAIRDGQAHGDVILWPLKALCDYVEATGDFAILAQALPWRREDNLECSAERDSVAAHVDKLIATVRARFVPGTQLLRYGNGDWNDSLQPVDPSKRDWMVSSWTVALLYEQLRRYAEVLRRAGRAAATEQQLAEAVREDFNRFLMRDGTVAGYAVFSPAGGAPELLFHPGDRRTGISYALLPMTQGMLGALFTPEQAHRHLEIIRTHLSFPDGVRLSDRPIEYHGGRQLLFQRAESAAYFGREIGLMYVHAHLRHAQAMALLGEAQELWDALLLANPIAVTERLAQAAPRQRNAYFSSSDAAFADRYQASAEWPRVRDGTVGVEGGWRIYSSGPGLYVNILIRHALGRRRHFGERLVSPCLPAALQHLRLAWTPAPASGTPPR